MKYLKILSFAAIVVTALMAFAGIASATELTSPTGAMAPAGTKIEAVSEGHIVFDSPIGNIECKLTISGTTLNTGSSSETVEVKVETFTVTSCTNGAIMTAINRGGAHPVGTLIVHTEYTTEADGHQTQKANSTNNGTLTSTGTEVKVNLSGIECTYRTEATDLGTLTGSSTTGETATLDISARLPEVSGGFFCGTSAPMTGSLKFTSPDFLNVD